MSTTPRAETTPDLMFLLSVANHVLMTEHAAKLERLGISPRGFWVLSAAASGEFTQKELAERCYVDKTTMVVTLDELEKAGLARRRPAPTDRRARIITVTEEGRRVVAEARRVIAETHADVLSALPDAERDALVSALSRLVSGRLGTPSPCERPVRRREPRPSRSMVNR
jgi:MarR family transcriptional regulator, transcriptional regulator for hemolysin